MISLFFLFCSIMMRMYRVGWLSMTKPAFGETGHIGGAKHLLQQIVDFVIFGDNLSLRIYTPLPFCIFFCMNFDVGHAKR